MGQGINQMNNHPYFVRIAAAIIGFILGWVAGRYVQRLQVAEETMP